jgi:hypothetical protein
MEYASASKHGTIIFGHQQYFDTVVVQSCKIEPRAVSLSAATVRTRCDDAGYNST